MSIVVCSFEGAARLGVCLDALMDQSIIDVLEVIVVDDGSLDATSRVAAQYPVTLIRHDTNQGLSAARNTGWRASSGPLVAFVDDDCVAPMNWAERLLAAWKSCDEHVVGIGGSVVAAETNTFARRYQAFHNPLAAAPLGVDASTTFAKRVRGYLSQSTRVRPDAPAQRVASLVGANMSFRRGALEQVGGFDPRRRFGGDETWLCDRLREHYGNSSLVFEPSVVMRHDFARDLHDVWRRAYAYGKGIGRNVANDGGFVSIQPLGLLAVMILAAMIVVPFVAFVALVLSPLYVQRRAMTAHAPLRERVLFPYVSLGEEVVCNAGVVVGWLRTKVHGRRSA